MNKQKSIILLCLATVLLVFGSFQESNCQKEITAQDILGNPEYLAFSYGGYREKTRETVPTVDELKEDVKLLAAMGVKILRTYNTQQYAHAANLLEAISQLKKEDADFEMYVMLGTWIECEGAWTDKVNHSKGHTKNNTAEIEAAVQLTNKYPDIVKVIAVGNEAMIQWAVTYYVTPNIILNWVEYLQGLKKSGKLPANTWITSSDNFESWGGGSPHYHTEDLAKLVKAVDFVSLHTYPFHDSHYNPEFWGVPANEKELSKVGQIEAAMLRAKNYAIGQYERTADYVKSLDAEKPMHIGETGWSTVSTTPYGESGSHATDEYKEKLYYDHMREWTNKAGISCFYFEAFDEQWKDATDVLGSENHFGLITLESQVKFALWDLVDKGTFKGMTRNGQPITKTYNGDEKALLEYILPPPMMTEVGLLEMTMVNESREIGEPIVEEKYVIAHPNMIPDSDNSMTYPSSNLKLNAWEGTCGVEMSTEGIIKITTGTGNWWGCGLEIGNKGENLMNFGNGYLRFEIKGSTSSPFDLGFQTGSFVDGTQVNNFLTFGVDESYSVDEEWKSYAIPISEINKNADLEDVTSLIFFRGNKSIDGKSFYVRNVYYSKE